MSRNQIKNLSSVKFVSLNLILIMIATMIVSSISGLRLSVKANNDSNTNAEVTVPANVTGFKATSIKVNDVTLTWNKVNGAVGYIIYKYDFTHKKWVRFVKTTSNNNTYKATKLAAGTAHKFAIRAYVLNKGKEVISRSYPTTQMNTYLANVTGIKSTSNYQAIKLTWNKVSGAKGYLVYQMDPVKKTWKAIARTSNPSYIIGHLKSATKYTLTVRAYTNISNKEIKSISFTPLNASTTKLTLAKVSMAGEQRYESTATHPYNKQTNTLVVRWGKVSNATSYQVYIYGGKYKSWTRYATVKTTNCTVSGLARGTCYAFRVRAINGSLSGAFSNTQYLRTAKMNFDQGGWEAMCRIVYHEVGKINSSTWDKPIVYVSDCVVNRYVAAKYSGNNKWSASYKKYSNIQDIIYKSGGFMSSAGLSRDGANYSNVNSRVKTAVYGAVYGIAAYNNIANDNNVYFWCNTSYKPSGSKVAYVFKIPWGYFNVWYKYWG